VEKYLVPRRSAQMLVASNVGRPPQGAKNNPKKEQNNANKGLLALFSISRQSRHAKLLEARWI
jgi:hypothetical protein